jgi:hypothetical protein
MVAIALIPARLGLRHIAIRCHRCWRSGRHGGALPGFAQRADFGRTDGSAKLYECCINNQVF